MLNYTHYRTVENESIAYEVIDMSDSCKDDPYSYHATVYDKIGEIKNSGYVMKYKKRYGLIVWK